MVKKHVSKLVSKRGRGKNTQKLTEGDFNAREKKLRNMIYSQVEKNNRNGGGRIYMEEKGNKMRP